MDDKIKKLYMNGFTYIEIAKQLNTSEIKIKHIIDIRLNCNPQYYFYIKERAKDSFVIFSPFPLLISRIVSSY